MMCVLYKVHLQHSPNAQLGFTAVVALLCQLPLATAGAARSPQSHCILLVLALSNLPGTFSWKRGGIVSFSTPSQPWTEKNTHLALFQG